MIVWITKPLALSIHDRQLAEHGGANGVREEPMLESALARPQKMHACGQPPPDLADLAAGLAFGLARNHPFVDGNKRTAAVACEVMILLNGARLETDDLGLYPQYLGLADGAVEEGEFAAWLRTRIVTRTTKYVQEKRAPSALSQRVRSACSATLGKRSRASLPARCLQAPSVQERRRDQ